ncbi:Dynein light chain 1, axonemal [Trichoplax sp. H2]|uniref:Dynein axonemal light chain 1 n=1 Tax=Trichoplax adhaerens TaxID=10228 RepID=B3RX87_TRIAD|nr:hypothetical protein TRIADDRAFT_56121 [Trichoplax adhaerens]EDV24373.1 hypothetical protein TRIADDRAFT_56121 [Trichoplax adhaerens]RDD39232.1 Dynein light chain 1, axonemal [Trichoplax sp. H2]|eukprot:XP_002112263.1 hypothetical protein TRIADDRAFT_56121 [Trichoplax adhaerens]
MSKGINVRDALSRWEERTGKKAADEKKIKICGMLPLIEKMDASLSMLVNCEQLSLSSNSIEKIANLNGLKNLKVLSLGRNNIKSLNGVEVLGDTLEQLWISYNNIEKLKGVDHLKKLKVLYMSNNRVKDWAEFQKLAEVAQLEDLLLVNNPIEEKHSNDGDWRDQVSRRLPKLKKLDGVPIVKQEEDDEENAED